jgi:hypothetical protein
MMISTEIARSLRHVLNLLETLLSLIHAPPFLLLSPHQSQTYSQRRSQQSHFLRLPAPQVTPPYLPTIALSDSY